MKQATIPGIGGVLCGELMLDNFCGGGGASEGMEQATGRSPDWACNHDPAAIQMHAANHPHTEHRCESIHDIDPREVVAGRRVGLLWASPSCTHFSRARGSVPVSRQLRALGWSIPRWAAAVRPRVIIAENVAEWQTWGPVRRGRPPRKAWEGKSPWEADHTVPVVEGGGGCGLDGYRTLCQPCHVRETAALAARLAARRRTA